MTDIDLQDLLDGVLNEFEVEEVKKEKDPQQNIEKIIEDSTDKLNDPLLDELTDMFNNDQFSEGLEELMSHLLTKDMLYEPLCALKEKYTELDDEQYKEQLVLVQKMISAFDNNDEEKIPEYIEQMQKYEMPKEFMDGADGCPLQ